MFDDSKDKGRRIPIEDVGGDAKSTEAAAAEGQAAGVREELAGEDDAEHLLSQLEAELAEVKEAHLRAVADLQNFRRRSAEERAQQMQFANEQLVLELLPLLDNFERATGCEVDGEAAQSLLRGVCMVQQQFHEVLERFGVQRLETTGAMFDPAQHDALERVETNEVCEGTIVGEVLPGYTLNGRVIRPAKVKVAVEPR
jgi:molecular chaperone GrpE